MNKHGFLRILEAIIAIIVVLGFVIAIIPQRILDTAKIPPNLEETMKSILTEMQDNPNFRKCVLGGSTQYDFNNDGNLDPARTGAECVYGYVEFLSSPIVVHPWNYAVRICQINDMQVTVNCEYRLPENTPVIGTNLAEREMNFGNTISNTGKNIYLKSRTLTFPDVGGEDPDARTIGSDPNIRLNDYTSLTIYAWSKN